MDVNDSSKRFQQTETNCNGLVVNHFEKHVPYIIANGVRWAWYKMGSGQKEPHNHGVAMLIAIRPSGGCRTSNILKLVDVEGLHLMLTLMAIPSTSTICHPSTSSTIRTQQYAKDGCRVAAGRSLGSCVAMGVEGCPMYSGKRVNGSYNCTTTHYAINQSGGKNK